MYRFKRWLLKKETEFVTFHQAYSYEEFVEGIRPVLADDEQWNESQDLKYRIEDGILKRITNAASVQFIKEKNAEGTETLSESSKIWKISWELGIRKKIYTRPAGKRNNSHWLVGRSIPGGNDL